MPQTLAKMWSSANETYPMQLPRMVSRSVSFSRAPTLARVCAVWVVGMRSTKKCAGCRENFYNGNNELGIKECWLLKDAKIVTRYKIHWWTQPTKPGAFTKVKTYSCHSEPGQFAFYEALPEFAKDIP